MAHLRLDHIFYVIFILSINSKSSGIKSIRLSSGHDMPIIGLGTWQLPPEAIDASVTSALQNGYTHIDTAFTYGNEDAIGKSLKKWFDEGNKREDLFITSKLPPYGMRSEDVEIYVELSLEKLGLQYLDMYLIHKPFGFIKDKYSHAPAMNDDGTVVLDLTTNHTDIWKAMEKQVKAGRIRSIGLSNFNQSQISRVFEAAEIKPSNLQIELQAYNQQKPMREFCSKHNITITAFSSLGSPGSSTDKKTKANLALPRLLDHPTIKQIASAHSRTTAQILLRHIIQNGIVVLPKSTKPARIRENFAILDFALTEVEMDRINGLDRGEQGRIFHYFIDKGVEKHPEYPFASQLKNENKIE